MPCGVIALERRKDAMTTADIVWMELRYLVIYFVGLVFIFGRLEDAGMSMVWVIMRERAYL